MIDELNDEKVKIQSKIDINTQVITELKRRQDQERRTVKINYKFIDVIIKQFKYCISMLDNLGKNFIGIVPILILIVLIVVDFFVGTDFIYEQYKSKIDSVPYESFEWWKLLIYYSILNVVEWCFFFGIVIY